MTAGLAALFDTRLGVELLSGARATVDSSTRGVRGTGVGAAFSGTKTQRYAHRPAYATTGAMSLFVFCDLDAASSYGALVAKQATSTTSAPYELRMGNATSETNLFFLRGGTNYTATVIGAGTTYFASTGKAEALRLLVTDSSNTTTFTTRNHWVNGVKYPGVSSSGSAGLTITDDGASDVWIGRRYDGATQLDGRIYYVALFNRVLSDAEAISLSANPWQLFAPLPRRIWAPTASTGTTGTGASTQAANTSATSGTVAVSGAATDTQAGNTSAATGTVDAGVTGTAAVTQASNTSAATGTVAVSGAGTTAQASNVSAGTGTVTVTGAAASTQTNGVTAGAGTVLVSGSAADTQAANTSAASGTVVSGVTGTGASTQAGNTSAAAGTVALSATAASTQALNTTAATGAPSITGTAAQAQATNTSTGTGTVASGATGSASVTQAANVSAASGTVTVTAAAASTQANGVTAGAGTVLVSGSAADAQAANTSAASGSVGNSVGVTVLVQDITSLLATLAPAGGVFYAVNTTEPPVYPYIVWQRVVSTANVSLAGPSNRQNTRVQIDIISRQISEATSIETGLEALMAGASIVNIPLSSQDVYENAIQAFRIIKDYSIWATN